MNIAPGPGTRLGDVINDIYIFKESLRVLVGRQGWSGQKPGGSDPEGSFWH